MKPRADTPSGFFHMRVWTGRETSLTANSRRPALIKEPVSCPMGGGIGYFIPDDIYRREIKRMLAMGYTEQEMERRLDSMIWLQGAVLKSIYVNHTTEEQRAIAL